MDDSKRLIWMSFAKKGAEKHVGRAVTFSSDSEGKRSRLPVTPVLLSLLPFLHVLAVRSIILSALLCQFAPQARRAARRQPLPPRSKIKLHPSGGNDLCHLSI